MPLMNRWLGKILPDRSKICRVADLRDFIASQAAFVSQKATIEYCRARAGLNWDKLFAERAFQAALEISRWEAFAAVLADLLVVVEGRLRPSLADRPALLADWLAAIGRDILARHAAPAHLPGGWSEAEAAIRRHLADAQLGGPRPAGEIGRTAGARVYETLPIHASLRGHDRELVTNNIRFGLVRAAETMTDRLDLPALAAEIRAEAGG
jgi:hypothetical protein